MSRIIVHLDADAFFASVEQAADCRLRGKPMAGQTASSTATTGQQTAWQVLNSINVGANEGGAPLAIYPPEFLAELQALGNSPYPPIPLATSAQASTKMSGGMQPMDDQQSDPPTYAVVDLGTLGSGNNSVAFGINASGEVVGYADTIPNANYATNEEAFLYSNGSMKGLGSLGNYSSFAYGINNSGQVTGQSYTAGNGALTRSFLWQNGVMQDIGTLGGDQAFATAINDEGQIVGNSYTTGDVNDYVFLYQNGSMQAISSMFTANAINDNSQIVGSSFVGNYQVASLYQNGSTEDLGTSGDYQSLASGINNEGQVVGYSYADPSGSENAFLWQNGSMQNLGTLGGTYGISCATGINDNGQVVGYTTTNVGSTVAFMYQDGTMYDLNSLLVITNSGWLLDFAGAINDNGQIVGVGINLAGNEHAVLLNPLPPGALLACTNSQTNLPPYGVVQAPQPKKDSLVFVTHGWIRSIPFNPAVAQTGLVEAVNFVDTTTNEIAQYLAANDFTNWQVYGYLWTNSNQAVTYTPMGALDNAYQQGDMIGSNIVAMGTNGWKHNSQARHARSAKRFPP